jgi:hypothetical protein
LHNVDRGIADQGVAALPYPEHAIRNVVPFISQYVDGGQQRTVEGRDAMTRMRMPSTIGYELNFAGRDLKE